MTTLWRPLRLALALTLAILMVGTVGINRATAKPIDGNHAKVNVIITQVPPTSQDMLTYTIKAANRGDMWAHYAKITVPFDSAAFNLLDVQFSGAPAWVTKIEATAFEIRTDRLNSNGGATIATVHFVRLPGASKNATLTERLAYTWQDDVKGGSGYSNLPVGAAAAQPFYTLTHRQTGGGHFFSSNVFVPGEPVVFWYHTPSGIIVPAEVKKGQIVDAATTGEGEQGADYALADADGALDLQFETSDLAAGQYTMVARGEISGFTAVGMCELP